MPRPSRAAESMPGRWANPTKSSVFSGVQLATTCEKLSHANYASLHQPCTRRAHPRERGYATPGRHDARLTIGHLTWPIALSDRTGLPPREEKPHRVQPGSTRVSQVHDPRYGLTPLA